MVSAMLGQKNDPLRILIVEDLPADAELAIRAIATTGAAVRSIRVDNAEDLRRQLRDLKPHVVLSDFSMPGMTGLDALRIVREQCPDIPFIFVSGTIGEERAIDAIKDGATDYVLKEHLARLPAVVERALKETQERHARRAAERELHETRERLESILTSLHDAVWSVAVPGEHSLFANQAMEQIYGRSASEFIKNPNLWREVIHPDDQERVAEAWKTVYAQGTFNSEYRILRPDGTVVWVRDWARAHRAEHGDITRIDGITSDITPRKQQEQHILRLSRIHAVLSGINAIIVRTHDRNNLLTECCRVLTETGGFRLACIGILNIEDNRFVPVSWAGTGDDYLRMRFGTPRHSTRHQAAWDVVLKNKAYFCNDIQGDGQMPMREEALSRGFLSFAVLPITVEDDVMAALLLYAGERGSFSDEEAQLLRELAADIGYALEHIEKSIQLEYLANNDALTGLLNRAALCKRLHEYLGIAVQERRLLPLVTINLERFSQINESLGRHAGDAVLQEVARRLRDKVEDILGIARIGADQFAIVASLIDEPQFAARLVENQVLAALSEPMTLQDTTLHISARAGIALAPADGRDADTLLVNADAAMRRAGEEGGRYLFYDRSMNASVAHKLALENRLRNAVREKQFLLYYQPKVAADTGKVTGAEGLIRWRTADGQLVSPGEFIPLLEETGLIIDVGKWVMEQALRDMATLRSQGFSSLRIAVNVSILQLRQADFIETVRERVAHHADLKELLDLEITESMIMDKADEAVAKLRAIRAMGVNIAIDDFGTGYSSLSLLSRLPITTLKIDRSFIVNMANSAEDMAVVSTIITLAHALNMRVVAEGVDSEEQLKLLRLLKCDEIQGYLFSPPVPFEQLGSLLGEGR